MSLVFLLIKATVGLCVSRKEEIEGLDSNEHGLSSAYGDFLTRNMNDLITEETYENKVVPEDVIVLGENKASMSKVEVIMRQSSFDRFKQAMNEIGVTGMTVMHVNGCGMQLGHSEYYRGSQVEVHLTPKIKVEIVAAKVPVEMVVNTARKVHFTGHIGDGKIFVYDVRNVVKIRTGEVDYDAMQGTME